MFKIVWPRDFGVWKKKILPPGILNLSELSFIARESHGLLCVRIPGQVPLFLPAVSGPWAPTRASLPAVCCGPGQP